jgi:hypothetical protein
MYSAFASEPKKSDSLLLSMHFSGAYETSFAIEAAASYRDSSSFSVSFYQD